MLGDLVFQQKYPKDKKRKKTHLFFPELIVSTIWSSAGRMSTLKVINYVIDSQFWRAFLFPNVVNILDSREAKFSFYVPNKQKIDRTLCTLFDGEKLLCPLYEAVVRGRSDRMPGTELLPKPLDEKKIHVKTTWKIFVNRYCTST